MLHINDLDPEVLYRILWLASGEPADDIDEWKHKLTLLQVCTKWYDLLKGYVFAQGFVDIHSRNDFKIPENNIINSCIFYADDDIVCKSNLGIITGRDKYNCDCVSKLIVGYSRELHISRYSHVLKNISALGVGYWLNLSSIEVGYYLSYECSTEFEVSDLDKLSMDASEYIHDIHNRAPNMTSLDLSTCEDKVASSTIPILIDHYAPQLQRLHISHPIILPLPQFSTELTSLTLDLSKYKHQHSSFYAKSLQSLHLHYISSSNFLWWMFHDFTTPGRIEFTNLTYLGLSYEDQTEQEQSLSEKYSQQARPYGSHMLQFPKLKDLILHDSPVDCDVFYTDTIPAHLDTLDIYGTCNSVVAASRLRFTSVNKMKIVLGNEEVLSDAFYKAADRYFGYTKIGSECIVNIYPLIDIQRTVSWVNVTYLRLRTVGFDELLKHIPNFYNLCELSVMDVSLSEESLSIIGFGLEEEELGTFKYLDTRLEYISIDDTDPEDPYNLLAILNHLIQRTKALREIKIFGKKLKIVEKSFLPKKFPHIDFGL